MNSQIDLAGASGEVYRYRLAEDGGPSTRAGGNFVYVKGGEGTPEVVFAGQTDNLMSGAMARWSEAVAMHGATHMFTRLKVSGAARDEELRDIVAGVRPVMNGPFEPDAWEAKDSEAEGSHPTA